MRRNDLIWLGFGRRSLTPLAVTRSLAAMRTVFSLPVVIAVLLCASGCGHSATLANETSAVGTPCSAGMAGALIAMPSCDTERIPGSDLAVYTLDPTLLHVGLCAASGFSGCSIAGDVHLIVPNPTLGVHTVADGATITAGVEATEGFVDIDGYDPVTGAVCGTFELTLEHGTMASGSFRASRRPCD